MIRRILEAIEKVRVTKRVRSEDVWTCPHCGQEIGEKEFFLREGTYVHGPCGGEIELPPPSKEMLEFIKAFGFNSVEELAEAAAPEAYVTDPGPRGRGSIPVAVVLHDAVLVIRGIQFEFDGEGWRVWAPAGTDQAAFDDVIAKARAAVEGGVTEAATDEQRALVAEYWNARESYDFYSERGDAEGTRQAADRMKAAARELARLGFTKGRMPKMDEARLHPSANLVGAQADDENVFFKAYWAYPDGHEDVWDFETLQGAADASRDWHGEHDGDPDYTWVVYNQDDELVASSGWE
jgi:hypothetical protein